MGYNRAGKRRTERQKRCKRLLNRLVLKAEAGEAPAKPTVPATTDKQS